MGKKDTQLLDAVAKRKTLEERRRIREKVKRRILRRSGLLPPTLVNNINKEKTTTHHLKDKI